MPTEALELTLLLADKEPEKYNRAAARWHVRFLQEVPTVDLGESQAVLALLAAIPVNASPRSLSLSSSGAGARADVPVRPLCAGRRGRRSNECEPFGH